MNDAKGLGVCLIGGTGRSGTTILRRVLASHPAVAAFPTEARFLIDPDGIVDFYDSVVAGWSPYVFDRKIKRLERLLREVGSREFAFGAGRPLPEGSPTASRKTLRAPVDALREKAKSSRLLPRYFNVDLEKSCPDFGLYVTQLIDRLVDFRYRARWTGIPRWEPSTMVHGRRAPNEVEQILRDFTMSVFGSVARAQASTWVVEDSPYNHLSFDRTLQVLPGSKLIHIYRDPRDVVASLIGMGWAPPEVADSARLVADIMAQWATIRASLPSESFREISLEELARQPSAVLRSTTEWLGLEWADELLSVDLSRSNAGRWRRDLSPPQQAEVARILGPLLVELGYES